MENDFIKEEIIKKYTQLRFYFDSEFANIIKKFRYMDSYKIDKMIHSHVVEENEVIHEFHQVKYDLRQLINKSFQDLYGFDFTVSKSILDSLGFRPCSCSKRLSFTAVA